LPRPRPPDPPPPTGVEGAPQLPSRAIRDEAGKCDRLWQQVFWGVLPQGGLRDTGVCGTLAIAKTGTDGEATIVDAQDDALRQAGERFEHSGDARRFAQKGAMR